MMAIIPPEVSIQGGNERNSDAFRDQERRESLNYQQRIYTWMLMGKTQKRILVDIQRIQDTNLLLEEAGYFEGKMASPNEIAEVLGVDAILTAHFKLKRKMTDSEAKTFDFLIGGGPAQRYGGTPYSSNTKVTLELYDQELSKVLWQYDAKLPRGMRSAASRVVDDLMETATKKSPYYGYPKK
ncbi:hypothetical protein HNQ92_005301 [Rhabdobacter roseus]|uniref:Uncharacterized protein n=1 Tax=Rhabdobacter roseus TaxID=1655419 RepID=A0A840U5N5_9BACT|nr:hypothetical protein [Rhabdobacter roseus]MBB5287139.1 hypothetical protein [Rhabdobacter roseus]